MYLDKIFFCVFVMLVYACGGSDPNPPEGPNNFSLKFTDWTTVNHGLGMVLGTIGGVNVTFSGITVGGAVTDESDTGFDSDLFSPALSSSDSVSIIGQFDDGNVSGYSYTITFDSPVENPVLHLSSLASQLNFDNGVQISKLSGDADLVVNGSVVTGVTRDGTPTDANGTIRLEGSFTTINFTALWNTCAMACGSTDGIVVQLGAHFTN